MVGFGGTQDPMVKVILDEVRRGDDRLREDFKDFRKDVRQDFKAFECRVGENVGKIDTALRAFAETLKGQESALNEHESDSKTKSEKTSIMAENNKRAMEDHKRAHWRWVSLVVGAIVGLAGTVVTILLLILKGGLR